MLAHTDPGSSPEPANLPPKAEGRETPKKEAGHASLAVTTEFLKGNLRMRHDLGVCKMKWVPATWGTHSKGKGWGGQGAVV